jgi:magnesium transporter
VLRSLLSNPVDDQWFAAADLDAVARLAEEAGSAAVGTVWIDVEEPTTEELDAVGEALGWHRLLKEDLVEADQRQKAERFGGDLLVVARLPTNGGEVYLVLRGALAVTVRRGWNPPLDALAREVRGWPEPEQAGATAVACAVLERVVRDYEGHTDVLERWAADQEDQLLEGAQGRDPLPALRRAAELRSDVTLSRRRSAQMREVLGVLVREDLLERGHGTAVSLDLRDIYDHILRVHDDLDVLNDRLIALQEARLQLVAYRQNEITKRISGWGALLLIPTVITGWYGMNFGNLWFLQEWYGHYVALGVAVGLVAIVWYLLRRAEWL